MANDSLASIALAARPVHGSPAPDQAALKSANGKPLPPSGMAAPPSPPEKVEVPKIDISRAIHNINAFLNENQRGLRFQVDQTTGRTVITVINPVSGEVVRQIPPQEVLNIARELRVTGVLVNAEA